MLLQKSEWSIQLRLRVTKVILFSIITIFHPVWPSASNIKCRNLEILEITTGTVITTDSPTISCKPLTNTKNLALCCGIKAESRGEVPLPSLPVHISASCKDYLIAKIRQPLNLSTCCTETISLSSNLCSGPRATPPPPCSQKSPAVSGSARIIFFTCVDCFIESRTSTHW